MYVQDFCQKPRFDTVIKPHFRMANGGEKHLEPFCCRLIRGENSSDILCFQAAPNSTQFPALVKEIDEIRLQFELCKTTVGVSKEALSRFWYWSASS
jgi:hypothetical protein